MDRMNLYIPCPTHKTSIKSYFTRFTLVLFIGRDFVIKVKKKTAYFRGNIIIVYSWLYILF